MNKHLYRTMLIWASVVVGLILIYPTIGWMALSQEGRDARRAQFEAEDTEWAKTRHGVVEEMTRGLKRWAQCHPDRVITLGLDLQGGIHMVLRSDYRELPPDKLKEFEDQGASPEYIQKYLQDTMLNQITQRINEFEAQEPIIQSLGTDRIQIQLPGEKDLERARRLIMMSAVLNFHLVAGNDETGNALRAIEDAFPGEFRPFVHPNKETLLPLRVKPEDYDRVKKVLDKAAEKGGIIPDGMTVAFSQPPKPYEEQFYSLYVMGKEPMAKGEGLTSAWPLQDDANPPYWQIDFTFNNAAGQLFGTVTEQNIERAMAIVLDGRVVSAPTIRDRITTRGVISGNFEAGCGSSAWSIHRNPARFSSAANHWGCGLCPHRATARPG